MGNNNSAQKKKQRNPNVNVNPNAKNNNCVAFDNYLGSKQLNVFSYPKRGINMPYSTDNYNMNNTNGPLSSETPTFIEFVIDSDIDHKLERYAIHKKNPDHCCGGNCDCIAKSQCTVDCKKCIDKYFNDLHMPNDAGSPWQELELSPNKQSMRLRPIGQELDNDMTLDDLNYKKYDLNYGNPNDYYDDNDDDILTINKIFSETPANSDVKVIHIKSTRSLQNIEDELLNNQNNNNNNNNNNMVGGLGDDSDNIDDSDDSDDLDLALDSDIKKKKKGLNNLNGDADADDLDSSDDDDIKDLDDDVVNGVNDEEVSEDGFEFDDGIYDTTELYKLQNRLFGNESISDLDSSDAKVIKNSFFYSESDTEKNNRGNRGNRGNKRNYKSSYVDSDGEMTEEMRRAMSRANSKNSIFDSEDNDIMDMYTPYKSGKKQINLNPKYH